MPLTPELVAQLEGAAEHGFAAILVVDADGNLLASVSPPRPRTAFLLMLDGPSTTRRPRPD